MLQSPTDLDLFPFLYNTLLLLSVRNGCTQFNAVRCITQNFPFGLSEHIAPLPSQATPWDRESCWRFVCQPCRARSCSKVLCTPLTKLESTLLITATHTISPRQRDYHRPISLCPVFFPNAVATTSG